MNNDAINGLRVPAAWALLGAVAARMLGGFIRLFGGEDVVHSFAGAGTVFFDPITVGLVALAAVLVVTAPNRTAANFPIVLTGMIMLGLGALMALLTLIMSFVSASELGMMANGFASLFEIAGSAAILAFAFIYLIKVFGDPSLVVRSQPAPQMGPMGQPGQPQGYAPPTGGQPAFGAPNPTETFSAQPQAGYDPYAPQAQDPQQAQQMYGQDPAQAYGTGGQPAYGDAYQQQDPYQQAYAQDPAQAYGTGGQPAYGDAYQQAYAQDPAQAYGTGGQPAYGDAYRQAYGQDPAQAYGTGGQPAYGDAYQQQDPYQQAYAQDPAQAYGTGGQPAYGDAYQQQGYDPYAQQQAYAQDPQQAQQAYDPSQYAPQPEAGAAGDAQGAVPGAAETGDQPADQGEGQARQDQAWYRDDDRR